MDSNTKSKWQIRVAVLAIFVIGFVAGVLATNIYRGQRWSASSREDRRGRFEQMIERLNLTPDQRTQVREIFDDARSQLRELRKESEPGFQQVRKQTDERLQSVLTPEQWEQFQKMMNRAEQRRERRGNHQRDQRAP